MTCIVKGAAKPVMSYVWDCMYEWEDSPLSLGQSDL